MPTADKTVVLSGADVVRIRVTFILARYEGGEQTANWVHNKLTSRNLHTKAVSHALKFAFFYQTRTFEVFLFRLVNIEWINLDSERSCVETFSRDKT